MRIWFIKYPGSMIFSETAKCRLARAESQLQLHFSLKVRYFSLRVPTALGTALALSQSREHPSITGKRHEAITLFLEMATTIASAVLSPRVRHVESQASSLDWRAGAA